MKRVSFLPALGAALAMMLAGPAAADINIGVTISATGPAASLGIPQKNTIDLLPKSIGGEKVNWIVLDDGSDTTKARDQCAQAGQRGQGRRHRRLVDDAQFAGDARSRRRFRNADDLAGCIGADHQPDSTRRRAGSSRRRRTTR